MAKEGRTLVNRLTEPAVYIVAGAVLLALQSLMIVGYWLGVL